MVDPEYIATELHRKLNLDGPTFAEAVTGAWYAPPPPPDATGLCTEVEAEPSTARPCYEIPCPATDQEDAPTPVDGNGWCWPSHEPLEEYGRAAESHHPMSIRRGSFRFPANSDEEAP